MAETIHFIITGGTLDSYYDGTKDTVAVYKKSAIPNFIKNLSYMKRCSSQKYA